MKFFSVFAGLLFIINIGASAQRFQKINISNTGLTCYSFCQFEFKSSLSEDGSTVTNGFCQTPDSVNYGIICVQLKTPFTDLDKAESTMIAYTNHVAKNVFGIKQYGYYGKGHRLNDDENTRGIIDYWTDDDKTNYKITSWTNGKYIVFMCVNSAKELNVSKTNLFLQGLRFP